MLGAHERVIRSRPLVLGGALLARLGLIEAAATWPHPVAPTIALNLRDATASSWMRPLLPARARALHVGPRAWQAARARGLVVVRGDSLAVAAAERALGRTLADPRVSLYSPSGCSGKLTCFVGESGRREPTVVVKAMATRTHGWWLRWEVEHLRTVRSLLSGETRRALLPPPLLAEEIAGEFVVVERYLALDRWCEPAALTRSRAHRWLHAFQRSTLSGHAPLRERDVQRAVASVDRAWTLVRPHAAPRIVRLTERMLGDLVGVALPRCASHGDFSACNLAAYREQLKVLDWEWFRRSGSPCTDLWSYELAELQGSAGAGGLDDRVRDAVGVVEHELELAQVDGRFALATLPAVLAEQVVRVRRMFGAGGMWELAGGDLMAAVERVVGDLGARPDEPSGGGASRPRAGRRVPRQRRVTRRCDGARDSA